MYLDFGQLPAFLLACVIVVITPGVDAFLLLRTSMRSGTRAGLLTLAGIHSASMVQVGLVISGLGVVLARYPMVLTALRWIGAAYLLYLAVSIARGLLWRRSDDEPEESEPDKPCLAGHPHPVATDVQEKHRTPVAPYPAGHPHPVATDVQEKRRTPVAPFRRGFVCNITNPKMLLFSLAFLPQFIGTGEPAVQLAMLAVVFLALAAVWEAMIVLAASTMAGKLHRPGMTTALDAVCATAFLTMSVGLVV